MASFVSWGSAIPWQLNQKVQHDNQPYEADVLALQQAGVILAQCENSMKAQNLTKEDMLPYISYVPTANGELIIRQAEGWSLVHL